MENNAPTPERRYKSKKPALIIVPDRPHYRCSHMRHNDRIPEHIPEFTVAWMYHPNSNSILAALSILCPGDSFCKKRGRRDAFQRLDALVLNQSLASEKSRIYFQIKVDDLITSMKKDVDEAIVRTSGTHAKLMEGLDQLTFNDLLHSTVANAVWGTAVRAVCKPKPAFGTFSLTKEAVEELDKKLDAMVESAAEEAKASA